MIREQALGKDHSEVASSLNNLAALYYYQDNNAKAEFLYQQSLAIWEATLGKNHPDVASSLNNLAVLYDSQGKHEKAAPLFLRSLAILEKVLSTDHPLTKQVKANFEQLLAKKPNP